MIFIYFQMIYNSWVFLLENTHVTQTSTDSFAVCFSDFDFVWLDLFVYTFLHMPCE